MASHNYDTKCLESDGTDCIFCPYTDPFRKNEYFNCGLSEVCCGDRCCSEHEKTEIQWYFVVIMVLVAIIIGYMFYRYTKTRYLAAKSELPQHIENPKKKIGNPEKKKQLFVNMDNNAKPVTSVFSHSFPTIVIQTPQVHDNKMYKKTSDERRKMEKK